MCWRGELLEGRRLGAFSWSPETRFLVFWENIFCLICSHTRTSFHFSACSVIVLVSCRKQKSSTGDNNFFKRKGTFQSNWLKWPDQSKRTTFKAGPEYSSQTKPKASLFHLMYQPKFLEFWIEWKKPFLFSIQEFPSKLLKNGREPAHRP